MSPETTVQVVIHGTALNFKTDDPDYIHEIARFIEEQIHKIESSGKVTSPGKAMALAAFTIADELFRLRKEKEELSEKLSTRLDAMLELAEKTYASTKPPKDNA
jgi:cell division protein ZapA (FtsZ GTPase activity inhibitor)